MSRSSDQDLPEAAPETPETARIAAGRWPLTADRDRPVPPASWSDRDFASREVGILSEQGGFERARMLLTKGLSRAADDPDLYVDAIRLERTAIGNGQVWQAWMSRALEAGVPIAERVFAIVPEEDLRALLQSPDLGWDLFAGQGDRAAAELLRLRLITLVRVQPARALDTLDNDVLMRAAEKDPQLRRLALGALGACALQSPKRVAQLVQRYSAHCSAPTTGVDPHAGLRAQLDALLEAALPGSSDTGEPMPAPLERALRLLGWCDKKTDRVLIEELGRDLRAQPEAHAACLDRLVTQAPRLGEVLGVRLGAYVLDRSQPVSEPSNAGDFAARASQRVGADPMRFLRARGLLYRRHVRPALIAALARQHASLPTFLASVRATPALSSHARAALEHADRDAGLALLGQLTGLVGSAAA